METKENKLMIKFTNIILAIIFFIMYIIFYNDYMVEFIINPEVVKVILSWLGIILYIYIIFSWYKLHGKIFDLYTIMITFFMLFNYGQCFLWAFGIHTDNEIGRSNLIGVGVATDKEIIVAQLITLICIYMFHLGSCFCYEKRKNINEEENEINKNSIYIVSKILSIIVIPVSFIQIFIELQMSSQYGYNSLYNDNTSGNLWMELIVRLFYPCLFGLLIGSNFKKRIRNTVYLIAILYALMSLLSGYRGTWLYPTIVLLFLHYIYVKKIKFSSILEIGILGIIVIILASSISNIRGVGVNTKNLWEQIAIMDNPLVDAISEMGGSMIIQTTLVKTGFDIYPYGNTYLFAILGVISDSFIGFLGFDYVDLSTWFSHIYLQLETWGIGFSIVGEALINYGPYVAPIIMVVLGWIFTSLTYIKKRDLEKNSLRMLISLISCISLIYIFRGIVSYNLKILVFTLIVYIGCIKLYIMYNRVKRS